MDTLIEDTSLVGPDKPKLRRRRFSSVFKRQVVEAMVAGGESVSVVARRYDINANQVFNWRKRYREGLLESTAPVMPVIVAPAVESTVETTAMPGNSLYPGSLEIMWRP